LASEDDAVVQRWYVVHVYSGFERKVALSIREQAQQKGMADQIAEVLVPTEEVVELRRGTKVQAERKFFPGYVLIKMEMGDETWHLVRNTPKVTGFLGSKGQPSPISEVEVERIMHQVQEGIERPKPSVVFEIGEQVRVSDGPFTSFNGFVEEVDEERGRLKVAVSIFGRATPVELEYSQVEKL
jgi:transcription termination/antitermination protein NusG